MHEVWLLYYSHEVSAGILIPEGLFFIFGAENTGREVNYDHA